MLELDEKLEIIKSFARAYENRCEEKLAHNLEALYLFGSYAFDKINMEMPDINYLLLLKEGANPDVFLEHAEILRELADEIKSKAQVIIEFRPNRYIYTSKKDVGFDFCINTQYARMEDRHGEVPFGWGWILESLLQTRKLVFGNDALAEVHQPPLTIEYIKKYFPGTFSHLWLPLERAPVQFKLPDDVYLLLHESYKVAQMSAIGFGVNLAMNAEEHSDKKWMEFVYDKSKLIHFYCDRYDEATAKNVELMLHLRDNWQKYKNDTEMAIRMYRAAINICTRLKAKYVEILHENR